MTDKTTLDTSKLLGFDTKGEPLFDIVLATDDVSAQSRAAGSVKVDGIIKAVGAPKLAGASKVPGMVKPVGDAKLAGGVKLAGIVKG